MRELPSMAMTVFPSVVIFTQGDFIPFLEHFNTCISSLVSRLHKLSPVTSPVPTAVDPSGDTSARQNAYISNKNEL